MVVESFSKFPATELQAGMIIPTGVILSTWEDDDDEVGRVIIAITSSGIGHAFLRDEMVEVVIGPVLTSTPSTPARFSL